MRAKPHVKHFGSLAIRRAQTRQRLLAALIAAEEAQPAAETDPTGELLRADKPTNPTLSSPDFNERPGV